MLFSAGMGIGLVFWGVAEPIMHFAEGPQMASAEETAREAMLLTYHHWGLGAWSVYAVLGLSLAYFGFRHNLPMTIRSALYPLIGNKIHGLGQPRRHPRDLRDDVRDRDLARPRGDPDRCRARPGVRHPRRDRHRIILIAIITLAATSRWSPGSTRASGGCPRSTSTWPGSSCSS
jgi:hypothetical protein